MAMMKREWTMIEEMNIADSTKDTYASYFRSLFHWAALDSEGSFKWYKLDDRAKFLELADDELQLMLERFLDFLNKRVRNNEISPNTVPKLFKPYKLILDANYREHAVKWKPISVKYPAKEKRSGYKPWTTAQILEMVNQTPKLKIKAELHFQASAGCRVGVHDHPLLMKHMIKMDGKDLENLPDAPDYSFDYHCYGILIYAEADETIEEKDQRIINREADENDYSFYVFLTPEASKALDKYHAWRVKEYGVSLTSDSPIFKADDKHDVIEKDEFYQVSGNAIRKMMEYVLKNTSIKRVKKRNRFDTMIDHGYRKRFNTILKIDDDINANIAEKLMQHAKGLDGSYLTPTRQECFKEFVKAIPELTVDPTERQKKVISRLDKEIAEKNFIIKENVKIKEKLQKLEDEQMQQKEVTRQQVLDIMEEQSKLKK